jgi:excisionase family DNA binding protein
MDEGRYYSTERAAQYTALSVSYIEKLTSRRRIPFLKIGRRVLYDKVLLDKWLARRAILPRDWGANK